jgi:hypothetical protein
MLLLGSKIPRQVRYARKRHFSISRHNGPSKPKSGFNICFLSYILLLPSFPYSFLSFSFYHFSLSFLISFFSLFVPVEAQLHYSVAGCMMVRGPSASKIVEVLGFTRCLV